MGGCVRSYAGRFSIPGLCGVLCLLMSSTCAFAQTASYDVPEIREAFDRLYSFDFKGAHSILAAYISSHPGEALPYAVHAAAYLFRELDRLKILESQYFTSDKQVLARTKLKPDPQTRTALLEALQEAQSRAELTLRSNPNDVNALLAMCISQGVASDYTALVERRQWSSLSNAKLSNAYAQRLLKLQPPVYDAYVAAGISEYLLGSMPFFLRWFVRFDGISGSKGQALRELQLVSREGHYLKPFAKILLSIIYLREKEPLQAEALLRELAREYPRNPLYHTELASLMGRLATTRP